MKKNKLIRALSNQLMERSMEVGRLKAENKNLLIQLESANDLLKEAQNFLTEAVSEMIDKDVTNLSEKIKKTTDTLSGINKDACQTTIQVEEYKNKDLADCFGSEKETEVEEYIREKLKQKGIKLLKLQAISINTGNPDEWIVTYTTEPETQTV